MRLAGQAASPRAVPRTEAPPAYCEHSHTWPALPTHLPTPRPHQTEEQPSTSPHTRSYQHLSLLPYSVTIFQGMPARCLPWLAKLYEIPIMELAVRVWFVPRKSKKIGSRERKHLTLNCNNIWLCWELETAQFCAFRPELRHYSALWAKKQKKHLLATNEFLNLISFLSPSGELILALCCIDENSTNIEHFVTNGFEV